MNHKCVVMDFSQSEHPHDGRTVSAISCLFLVIAPFLPHRRPPSRLLTLLNDFAYFEFCKMDSYSVLFNVQLLSLSVMFVRFNHIWGIEVICSLVMMDEPQFIYPFCRLIFALFSVFGYQKKCCFEHSCACIWWAVKWSYQFIFPQKYMRELPLFFILKQPVNFF